MGAHKPNDKNNNRKLLLLVTYVRLAVVVEETGGMVQTNAAEPAHAPRWVWKAQQLRRRVH
jgi:hypothetical protein